MVLSEVEQRCNAALVRLGAAEQRSVVAQQDLEMQNSECAALMSEMSAIQQAFEETVEQNTRMMQDLAAKEEATARLMLMRQKEANVLEVYKQENEANAERLAIAQKLNDRLNDLRATYEQQMRNWQVMFVVGEEGGFGSPQACSCKCLQESLARGLEERAKLEEAVEQLKKEAREARLVEQQASAQLKVLQEAEARSLERERVANAAAANSEAEVKRLAQARDSLQRQLNHKRTSSDKAGGAATMEVAEQLEYYRGIVKCHLCTKRDKNTVIVKCGHTFCRECIDQRLNIRSRKCPTCGIGIDYQSVRELFLTS